MSPGCPLSAGHTQGDVVHQRAAGKPSVDHVGVVGPLGVRQDCVLHGHNGEKSQEIVALVPFFCGLVC